MLENHISATLSAADRQDVLAAIETIRQKLPFLVDLTPEERRSLPKMGDKSRAFVRKALNVSQLESGYLPRSFSVEEMARDVALVEALEPIMAALTSLQELVADTYIEVGSEAYSAALIVYQFARTSGEAAGLEVLLDDMGRRFARKSRGPKPPAPDDGDTQD